MKFFVERLKEPSTWRGMVLVLTALGITMNPDLVAAITAVGTGVAGLIGVLAKDRLK